MTTANSAPCSLLFPHVSLFFTGNGVDPGKQEPPSGSSLSAQFVPPATVKSDVFCLVSILAIVARQIQHGRRNSSRQLVQPARLQIVLEPIHTQPELARLLSIHHAPHPVGAAQWLVHLEPMPPIHSDSVVPPNLNPWGMIYSRLSHYRLWNPLPKDTVLGAIQPRSLGDETNRPYSTSLP